MESSKTIFRQKRLSISQLFKSGKLPAAYCLLLIISLAAIHACGESSLDSLLKRLPESAEDTNKVLLLIDIGKEYKSSNATEAVHYEMLARELAEKINYPDGRITACHLIEKVYIQKSHPDSAIKYEDEAIQIATQVKDTQSLSALLNNKGAAIEMLSNYPKALECYFSALALFEKIGNRKGQANSLNNIANVYNHQLERDRAIETYKKALPLYEAIGSKSGAASVEGNIGAVFAGKQDYKGALPYFEKSFEKYVALNDSEGMERNLANIGELYLRLNDYGKAVSYFRQALKMAKSQGWRYQTGHDYALAGEIYYAIAADNSPAKGPFPVGKSEALKLAKSYDDSAITALKDVGNIENLAEAYSNLSDVRKLLGDYKGAFDAHVHFKQLNDSIFNIEKDKKIAQTSMQYEFDKKEVAAQSEQEKKDTRQRTVRNFISAGFAGALVFLLVVFRQRNKISKEKKRSDELLLNILPEEVAEELKAKGKADAKQFDDVTVLFTDFKNFTGLSEQLTAQELVNEINFCYSEFDHIISKYGIEKIKTIGDSYMCAGGLPVPKTTNAIDTVGAALEIRDFMLMEKNKREAEGKTFFEIRIGIHTGPVVAGIVGVKKFAYDIWGDTVNIASRMESSGEAGKVNISTTTYLAVKNKFTCTQRGKISAKNKGEIEMFFVEKL